MLKNIPLAPNILLKLQAINIRKIFRLGLLVFFLLISGYLLYIASKQDYSRFSPTRDFGRPAPEKSEESEKKDYMDFINEPPMELPRPF